MTSHARTKELTASPASDGLAPVIANAPHRIGTVVLTVRNIERVSSFYERALGLVSVDRTSDRVRLGTGKRVLIELRRDPDAPLAFQSDAGLFHAAFLLPSRAALGAWLAYARKEGVALLGASNHLVSEAVYLADPEGNGIEIYADRPQSDWRGPDGSIRMATEPLDIAELMSAAQSEWSGFPADGTIGHVHLKVGDLDAAAAFYGDLLGFEITARYPGARFFGSGGYHHQLAANVWTSRGASHRQEGAAGLAEIEILTDERVLDVLRSKLPTDSLGSAEAPTTFIRDPWGTRLTLRTQ